MQPSSREMLNGIPPSSAGASAGGIALHELHNGHQQQQIGGSGGMAGHFDHSSGAGAGGGGGGDDFFDQMLSGLPSAWPELADAAAGGGGKLFGIGLAGKSPEEQQAGAEGLHYSPYDESSLLATRLRQHQISGGNSPGGKPMVLQLNHHQHQMMIPGMGRSPTAGAGGGDGGLLPLPLTLGSGGGSGDSRILGDRSRDDVEASFKSPTSTGGEGLYNGFSASLQRAAQAANQQHFHHPQGGPMPGQSYGGPPSAGAGQPPSPAPAASSGGGGTAPPRQQRVRARRGQATDPHSIAERLRRERIAERMKALQELVPNANKTDKASMLDEIIDYVKFLQLQVKVLSMSRLGGAAAVAPLVADMSSEGQGGAGRSGSSGGGGSGGNDSLTVTEHQVAKLMEEDMGSAMQYLQGKGLCLMPISLASAISSATCHPRPSPSSAAAAAAVAAAGHSLGLIPPSAAAAGGDNPSSPSMSVLTVQSAMANGDADASRPSAKDAASVSKP